MEQMDRIIQLRLIIHLAVKAYFAREPKIALNAMSHRCIVKCK